ncbi:MAG TPA: hypothetical protein VED87_11695, partial [Methylocystis sp.]|nr:hypothetical protein [Methylocystis sp.]
MLIRPSSPSRASEASRDRETCAGGAGAIAPFRERPPWIGCDLQTMRNFLCGGPPDLPGGERLWL